jgi:FMN phosphatase YigB (HAD superfamily)
LFSFDVFDTFLYRRCATPDGVFESAFNHGPLASRFPDSVETFVQHRIQAEAKARRLMKETCDSTEVAVAEIYERFPFRLFGLDRARLPELVDAEFKAELDLCFVNPDMRLLFEELRASGVCAGFISDTYWTGERLAELLRACAPGLAWDFLYASCDHGTGKRGDLFRRYLADQEAIGGSAIHIGDNAEADVSGARRHGLRAMYYPQASPHFAGVLQREGTAHGLFPAGRVSRRLDGGLSTTRRIVAGHLPAPTPAFTLGAEVIGPVMTAFDHFVADRVEKLARSGGNLAVAFLARDGRLSFDIWCGSRSRPAHYVEVNRRCSLVASADTTDPLADLFGKILRIDAAVVADILKYDSPHVRAFFDGHPGGIAPGETLAKALPELIGPDEIAAVAGNLRRELMVYLRRTIPGFDGLSDLVVVDLGYSGSVQKALRRALDHEGVRARLHGLYLLTVDEAFEDLAPDDTAEGFISDLAVTPHVNRMFMRNIAVLEQLCCSADGTVSGYRDGEVQREPDRRSAQQIALAGAVQAGALHFAERAAAMVETHGLRPFDSLSDAAASAAAILGRLLVLPTDDDIVLLGGLEHDVNLGTRAMVPMSDPRAVDDLSVAAALPTVCTANAPPMWMGASMAGLSPVLGYLYAQHGAGGLPGDLFADVPCGRVDIGLVLPGETRLVPVTCLRTGFAEIRLRIPLKREWKTQALAIPIDRIASEGLIRGVTVQTGPTVNDAMRSPDIRRIPIEQLHGAGIEMIGRHFRSVAAATRHLVVPSPRFTEAVAVISLTLAPFGDARVLALAADA